VLKQTVHLIVLQFPHELCPRGSWGFTLPLRFVPAGSLLYLAQGVSDFVNGFKSFNCIPGAFARLRSRAPPICSALWLDKDDRKVLEQKLVEIGQNCMTNVGMHR
jgi:hypothetical protein